MTAPNIPELLVDRSALWRSSLAAICGLLMALALPPIYAVPLLWPGLAGLTILLATSHGTWRAVLEGWFFGIGFFSFGLYWIGHAFLVDADKYAVLMPFAVIGISIGMALFIALMGGVTHLIMVRFVIRPAAMPAVIAACWTITEWSRGYVLTGFPWNPLGSVWGASTEMMQSAAWIGSLGLGFFTALVFAAPATLVLSKRTARTRMMSLVLGLSVILPGLWAFGAVRLSASDTVTRDDVVVRLIQPAIPQADKWKRDLRQGHVLKQMAMSNRAPGLAGLPTAVIWAETNVPFAIGPESLIPAELAPAVPRGGHLIFGAPRRDSANLVYNSLFVINDDGRLQAKFDKFHLVPFGEYVPLRGWLPFEKLTEGRGDFTPGPGPRTVHVDGLPPFAAIICYEVIFSGNVVDPNDRPEWIVNITNDAWFGPSAGPRQHFVQAQFRAIEEGLPLVRVANTGISAVIDPYGRVRNEIDLGIQGVVDAPLPPPLAPPPFVTVGQLGGLALAFVAIVIANLSGRRIGRS